MNNNLENNELVPKKKNASSIAINLKKLMELANISESELSRRTNVKQPIIHRLLSGQNLNPKLLTLKPLADYFMLSISQLIGEQDIRSSWKGFTSKDHNGWNQVPLISCENLHKRSNINNFIMTECKVSTKAFAMYISDSSMQPLFPENCLVIVEPELVPVSDNYIILQVSNEKKPILRHFIKIGKKNFINAFNNNFGTIREILKEDKILGTVIRTIYDHKIQK